MSDEAFEHLLLLSLLEEEGDGEQDKGGLIQEVNKEAALVLCFSWPKSTQSSLLEIELIQHSMLPCCQMM